MSQLDIRQCRSALPKHVVSRPSRGLLSNVSIVVPIGPNDTAWRALIGDLTHVGRDAELLLVATQREPADFRELVAAGGPTCRMRWAATAAGRAVQMNFGVAMSDRPFLWFLHADTRLSVDALVALDQAIQSQPYAVSYFDLEFQSDGPSLSRLNALGVRIRSRLFKLPFGDQGLCMSRDAFERLGGFDERTPYGEDHLLIWAAHREKVPVRRVGARISTSARKYRDQGWLRTTVVHGWRTWRQAIPELGRLLWNRCQ